MMQGCLGCAAALCTRGCTTGVHFPALGDAVISHQIGVKVNRALILLVGSFTSARATGDLGHRVLRAFLIGQALHE